jgi:hypothetical protein
MVKSDLALRELVAAIVKGDDNVTSCLLTASPGPGTRMFPGGSYSSNAQDFLPCSNWAIYLGRRHGIAHCGCVIPNRNSANAAFGRR